MNGLNTVVLDDLEMELLEGAAVLQPNEREHYLNQACPDSPMVREKVWQRLASQSRMAGFLLTPVLFRPEKQSVFQIGELVAGRFEIRREIAEGGMAVVFEAFDRKVNRRVALKVPKSPFRKRLLQELRSALEVTHPNICRLYEIHSADSGGQEVEFLTMQYVEGETLAEHLRRRRLQNQEALRIACEICAGLGEAHSRHIVHGDLKPSNILLASKESNRAVITDFGLAYSPSDRAGDEFGRQFSLRGTPDYAAPELATNGVATTASDVYALGVILHELATGRQPSEEKLSVAKPWKRAIEACLAKDPARRPSTAQAVSSMLCKKPFPRWLWMAAIVATAVSGAGVLTKWNADAVAPIVRMAILPAQTDSASAMTGSGATEDLSERSRGLDKAAKPLVVIPVRQAERFHVGWADLPKNVLGATHTLALHWTKRGREVTVAGEIRDAGANRVIRSFRHAWDEKSFGAFPEYVAAELSQSLERPVTIGGEAIPIAAYAAYADALYYLHKASDHGMAGRSLRRALDIAPTNSLLNLRVVESGLLSYASNKSPGDLEKIRQSLDLWWNRWRTDPTMARIGAELTAKAGDSDKASERYRAAAAQYPLDGELWRGLAETLRASGQSPEEALDAYSKASHLEPDYFQPFLDAGVFFYYRGRYAEAKDRFAEAARLAPGLALTHRNLASVFSVLNDYEHSEQEFHQALNIERTPETLAGIGALLAYQRRHSESVQYYEQAVDLGPEDSLMLSNLADSYRGTNRANQAKTTYSRVVEASRRRLLADPSNASDRAFKGYALARLGERLSALRETAQALRFSPADVQVKRRAIATFEALGMRKQALEQLRKAPVLVSELSRQSDLADLLRDPRFQEMSRNFAQHSTEKNK